LGSYRISQSRSQLEYSILTVCVLVLLVACIGSTWLPMSRYSPIFILVAAAVTWLGTTMFYSAFLYGKWERRALLNIIEELELLRASRDRGNSNAEGNSYGQLLHSDTRGV